MKFICSTIPTPIWSSLILPTFIWSDMISPLHSAIIYPILSDLFYMISSNQYNILARIPSTYTFSLWSSLLSSYLIKYDMLWYNMITFIWISHSNMILSSIRWSIFFFFFFCAGLCDPISWSFLGGVIPSQNSGYKITRICPYLC